MSSKDREANLVMGREWEGEEEGQSLTERGGVLEDKEWAIFFKSFFNICFFIWLCQVALQQDLQLSHMGSRSLIRDQTWAPCIWSVEPQPPDHQASPRSG